MFELKETKAGATMSVLGLNTDQQEYGKSWSALGVVATISAAWQVRRRRNRVTLTARRHKEDNLAGDMIDPRRKYSLHCVLEAVIISSEPSETTSTGNFQGDRAQADDNLTGDTIHPATPGHTVAVGFLSSCSGRVRAWISVLGVLHQKEGKFDERSVHLDSGQKLDELMLAPSAALKIVSLIEPCILASEDHASHTTHERRRPARYSS